MSRIIQQLQRETGLKVDQIEKVIALIDEGNTIPFISRYRKEVTGGLDDETLRLFDERLTYVRNLEQRKSEVLRIIEEQGKLTEELKTAIEKAEKLQKVEDLYRPYKQKKRTRGVMARERGLEPLAALLLLQQLKPTYATPEEAAMPFVKDADATQEKAEGDSDKDAIKGPFTVEEALQGARDIIAEDLGDDAGLRERMRKLFYDKGVLVVKAVDEAADTVYNRYYGHEEGVSKIPNHRILAIDRGENEKVLKVAFVVPEVEGVAILASHILRDPAAFNRESANGFEEQLKMAAADSYKRLVSPSVENEVRGILTERAQTEAIKVFAKNTKPLLLIPPLKDRRVLAADPGFRTGCKIAILDDTGKILDYGAIFPNEPQKDIAGAKRKIIDWVVKHGVNVIAIGNGTASRETEKFIADVIRELTEMKKAPSGLSYTIVSEAGASVYSASKLATEEYPDLDVTIRGAISIGRRLQDPLAELVKIDPKSIGVGQYQHDVNQKQLSESLANVVEDCVNHVGVDLNMATPSLLRYIAGINETVAKNIVEYRDENGKFTNRKQIKKVKKLGDKAFTQCAGFLRIPGGDEPLDNTAVHPESYTVAQAILKALDYKKGDLTGKGLADIDERLSAKFGAKREKAIEDLASAIEAGIPTVTDILGELKKPGRDPREDSPPVVLRSDVLSLEDLVEGMELTGTVRNVVDFGAFVDIGVKQDGLVHLSAMADRFVKNPYDVVSVGDVVKVRVLKVDVERKKISLSMKGIKQDA